VDVFTLRYLDWKRNKEFTYLVIASFVLVLYLSPLFLLGENAHIRVHDNLDSNLAWYKVLARSGELFGAANATIPQVINGQLSRNAYGTEYSGIVLLHALFPTMTAYALSQTITRVFAFIGMYLLLKKHFIKEENAALIRISVALAFALTPFWPSGMLSTLGQPLALWAFLNIREKDYSWKNWLTLALLPLYASIVLGFFFFLVAMGLLWLRDVIVRRSWNWAFLGSIAFMTTVFLLTDYRLVYSLVFPHELSHRVEFVSSRHDFWRSIRLTFKNFIFGHNHVKTEHTFIIFPALVLAYFSVLFQKKNALQKKYLFLFWLNFVLSAWYAFWFNNLWEVPKEMFTFLTTFNFARFHFLRPLIIYLSFALACMILWKRGKWWKRIALFCVIGQIVLLLPYNEEIRYRIFNTPSVKEFYATRQFTAIKDYIDLPQHTYRVASIGLHPAIAQYNGFYTIDTYNNFYPLTYKHQFRKIIEHELEKNKALKKYFDTWGGRCYIFVDELGKKYDYEKDSTKKINNLDLNTEAFKKMGGQFIFSAVPIVNADHNKLELMNIFHDERSAWKIYLYQVQ
jgi:hypothetical protein